METYIQEQESKDAFNQDKSIVLQSDSVLEKMKKNNGGDSTLMMYNEGSTIIERNPSKKKNEALFAKQELMSPNGAPKKFNFDLNITEKQDLLSDSKDFNIGSDFPVSLDLKENLNHVASSNIGKTEISFIKKKEEVSFVDSFLQE